MARRSRLPDGPRTGSYRPQCKDEVGATLTPAFSSDRSTIGVQDALTDCESQPHPRCVTAGSRGPEEGRKQLGQLARIDTNATVTYTKLDHSIRSRTGCHFYLGIGRAVFVRVAQEVVHAPS